MLISRRAMIGGLSAVGLSGCASYAGSSATKANINIDDEAYWAHIAKDFERPGNFINLENGYWGVMPRPVLARYLALTREINTVSSYFVRRQYDALYKDAVRQTTHALGAKDGEVVLTRGATEALKGLIGGYKGLKPGDAVLYADLDYPSMQASMDWIAARDGCRVVRVSIPEPVTHDALIQFYADILDANPAIRLMLLTHLTHKTGLIMPVKSITEMARAKGVDIILDAAHAWGQIDFQIDDLGADFIGFNLHKWIGAPVGVGAMYVKADRLQDISTDMAASKGEWDLLKGRVHSGTSNFAAMLTVPTALAYHEKVGRARKESRLRYLRNVWVEAVQDLQNLQILTPNDPRCHAAITSFRFKGVTSVEANIALVERLLKEHGIFTVHRTDLARGACVRVTPSIYNSVDDCLAIAAALKALSRSIS